MNLIKRLFTAALALPLGVSIVHARTDKPVNVLMIAIDDLNTALHVNRDREGNFLATIYPDSELREQVGRRLTPNLDRFARSSRPFPNAMCQSPLCGPSRTAVMTGIPTHVSGYYGHRHNFRTNPVLRDVITLPQYLKANGYFTTGLGKIFHRSTVRRLTPQGDWPDTLNSWSQWVSKGIGAALKEEGMHPFAPAMGGINTNMNWGTSVRAEETADWLNASFTRQLLEAGTASQLDVFHKTETVVTLPNDTPFLVACGIFRPHLPFYAPQSYIDLFPISEMTIDQALLDSAIEDLTDLPPAARKWTQLTNGKFSEIMTQGANVAGDEGKLLGWKYAVQSYLACVAFADACVGEILMGLERGDHADNTAVIIWSDHGYFLGNKTRIAKQCLWRESLNSVLMIRTPEMALPGTPSLETVQLTDLYATISSICGLARPQGIMGADLTPILNNPSVNLDRDFVVSTYQEGNHAIYNNKIKFIRYQNGDQEFYDLAKDPGERTNLADTVSAQEGIAHWESQLDNWLNTTKELGL